MSKLSRTKGHSYEREVAKEFREMGFSKAERQLEYQISEAQGVDLKNTDPFKVQCKRGKKYASITKIEEVKPETGAIPILVTRGDNTQSAVVMYLSDFKWIVKRLLNIHKGEEK